MVMRWKILELAESADDLEALLDEMEASHHFDISRDNAIALLRQYSDILPSHLTEKLEHLPYIDTGHG